MEYFAMMIYLVKVHFDTFPEWICRHNWVDLFLLRLIDLSSLFVCTAMNGMEVKLSEWTWNHPYGIKTFSILSGEIKLN